MKLPTKAALFSTFVFPGSGYFIVDRKAKGVAFVLVVLSIVTLFMVEVVYKAQLIAQEIVAGHISYEISAIREQIILMPGKFDANIITLASWLLSILWLVSIVDAYRLGRAIDKE